MHVDTSIDLSVIIPTRDRPDSVKGVLNTLAKVRCEWPAEILLLDNGSVPLVGFQEQACGAFQLRVERVEEPGLHVCRNYGAVHARGEVLAYLDDDVLVSETWTRGVAYILNKEADAIAGRIFPSWENTEVPDWLDAFYIDGVCPYLTLLDLGDQVKLVDPFNLWGANFMLRRDLVLELGGFPPDGMPKNLIHLRGDGENGFFRKFSEAGYKSLYVPDAEVAHCVSSSRLTLEYFEGRAYAQGISDSFSQIRLDGGIEPSSSKEGGLFDKVKQGLLWRKNRILEELMPIAPEPVEHGAEIMHNTLRRRMEKSCEAGYKWHRDYVRSHPEMLDWILRDSWI